MKLRINKKSFLTSWGLAEKNTTQSASSNALLSSIFIHADSDGVVLKATDIKNSIICTARGVEVLESGESVFPVKIVSDLFKKIPGEEFVIDVTPEGRVFLFSERSKFNFSSYPVREFPALKTSEGADKFCRISASDLSKILDQGTIAATIADEFPLYLSSADIQIENSRLSVVSTDTRRLTLSSVPIEEGLEGAEALLPIKGIKELQRVIYSMEPDTMIDIFFDDAQFFFKIEGLEFTVRRVESKFPNFKKIIPKNSTLNVVVDRTTLISALERINIIVRDYTSMALFDFKPGEPVMLRGRAPDFGQAKEEFEASVEGDELRIAINVKYLLETLKVLRESEVKLSFNGTAGHVIVKRTDSEDFISLIAPINVSPEEMKVFDTDFSI